MAEMEDSHGETPISSATQGMPPGLRIGLETLYGMRIVLVGSELEKPAGHGETLRGAGFSNIVCAPHSAAHTQLREDRGGERSNIDLVIADARSSEAASYELCRFMRRHAEWADIPVVLILDASAPREDLIRICFEAGVTDTFSSPATGADLVQRVIAALSLKRERDLRKYRERELKVELAERRIMETRLQYLVAHDDLTGLANRRHLIRRLEESVERARQGTASALLYLDLDHFKLLNDVEGHMAGDNLLVKIANLLRGAIEPGATLARVSGDEYAILISDTTRGFAAHRAEELRSLLEHHTFIMDERRHHLTASIGIAMIEPGEVMDAHQILAQADQACYVAKTVSRNTVHIFSAGDAATLNRRSASHWVPRLRDALVHGKFTLVFQPVMQLRTRRITHHEALIRMTGDDGQLIPPGNFIPVAESTGLIHDVDIWVIERAINLIADMLEQGKDIALNINVSGHAFLDHKLIPRVEHLLAGREDVARRLTFEITETAAVAHFDKTREMLIRLRQLGFRLCLDDFGSGFNSFSYLKQFPVDVLKIDGAFITNLLDDTVDQALVKTMIRVAKMLGKEIVAEFVENEEVLTLLEEYGADFAQGYHIGKPSSGMRFTQE